MASIKDLYTRDDCNQPTRMTIGDEWLDILGTDSDEFQKAKRQVNIDVISGKLKADEVEAALVSALVIAWSFDEPCDTKNKIELLKNSPSLADAIDRAASKRADFVGKLSVASKATQKKSST